MTPRMHRISLSPRDLIAPEREHLKRLRRGGAFVVKGAFRVYGSASALNDRVVARLIGMGLAACSAGKHGIVRLTLTERGAEFARALK